MKILYYSKKINTIKQNIENVKNCIKSILKRPLVCVGDNYELSDVKSSLSENGSLKCSFNSLKGESNICELPQDIIDTIINEFKSHKELGIIKSLLTVNSNI